MANGHRVVDHIVGWLAQSGIGHIFGVDGANIEDLYDAAFFRDDITAVLAKHEFSAAAMADGYSRSGAGIGVVAATSGGGCLNTVPGLGESLASRVPVLALIGQPPTTLDGRGSFQDTSGDNGALDALSLFSAVSVYCRRVISPDAIHTVLPEALAAARTGGPAVLLLPKDVQQAEIGDRPHVNGRATGMRLGTEIPDLNMMVRALRRADGPITIFAGEQVARDDARVELERLRATLRARIATVPDAKDVGGTPGFGSSSALGVSGVMGHPGVVTAAAGSGACLLVGTRMSVTARAGLDGVLGSVPTYSIGAQQPYVPATHVHTDDLRGALTMLAEALTGNGRPHQIRVPDTVPRTELATPHHDGPGIRYRDAMRVLDRALPDGTDIVVDAGNIGASAIHHLPVRRDGRFLVALGMGGMGYSFGAGIGMTFHRREHPGRYGRRTVVIAGDGSFFMHGMEIHTAVQYRLPITFLLFDNHAHAMCVTREQLFYEDRYSYNRFGPSRLGAGLAAMLPGLTALDVDDVDGFSAALDAALGADGPSVISVECSPDEIPPFAAFLANSSALTQENDSHVTARA
ncbi:thiamine pyrophosphate-binding protein [Mycolicibacterium goodii]|uniref:thiamine pyrophosphate-binding protein n=1 Tax=Mycolicibacterium goodii TaxID=134601 RepID=UPI00093AFB5E|nr:thiamine pyrophosphate-dependent enzyme [Mycolicibacterium goodii]MBU8816558.1 thiamine pyrophosphate-binding protein [Mycolicibacterium goodii]MBU8831671.1 thiamine pyrophosphate-binding protein [Mycolicibacterium goodii]OKH73751.1 acetolactate synthase [Mycobacterium sp. SWH-M5]ULN49073.1 thiamine pyrophosphate-binding protein [Mycolicibacterium goodii]